MKVGILTLPLRHNYGGILQAFALQFALKKLGHEVVIINRQKNEKSKLIERLTSASNKFFKRKRVKISASQYDFIYKNNIEFINQQMNISAPLFSKKAMERYVKEHQLDAVIVGSDQVWRPGYTPDIYNYYLDFLAKLPIKRVAYAASFGVDSWEYTWAQTIRCRQLVKKFDAVSVREKSGLDLCQQHFGIDAKHNLDPTLLLTQEDYRSLIQPNSRSSSGKLFTYVLDATAAKSRIISEVAQDLSLTEFTSQPKEKVGKYLKHPVNDYVCPPVENWVDAFDQAEFVVTDSFHGCVFSIIFQKPFIAIANNRRGLARFQSLLDMLGLSDRLILDEGSMDLNLVKQEIDWEKVNAALAKMRSSSIDFLREM